MVFMKAKSFDIYRTDIRQNRIFAVIMLVNG